MTAETDVVVACAADRAYAMPLAAMLHSAFVGLRPTATITAHIIDAGLSATDRARVEDLARSHGAALHWHEPSVTSFDALPAWGRMTSTTYHRLLLPQLLPRDVTCGILLTTRCSYCRSPEPREGRRDAPTGLRPDPRRRSDLGAPTRRRR